MLNQEGAVTFKIGENGRVKFYTGDEVIEKETIRDEDAARSKAAAVAGVTLAYQEGKMYSVYRPTGGGKGVAESVSDLKLDDLDLLADEAFNSTQASIPFHDDPVHFSADIARATLINAYVVNGFHSTMESFQEALFQDLDARLANYDLIKQYAVVAQKANQNIVSIFDQVEQYNSKVLEKVMSETTVNMANPKDSERLKEKIAEKTGDEAQRYIAAIDANDSIRFFKHQSLAIVTFMTPRSIEKSLDKEKKLHKQLRHYDWYSHTAENRKLQSLRFISNIKKLLLGFGKNHRIEENIPVSDFFGYFELSKERGSNFKYMNHPCNIKFNAIACGEDIESAIIEKIDKFEVQEALDAIITNAFEEVCSKEIEAGHEITKSIDVKIKKHDQEISFIVTDNGRGIPNRIKSRIFDLYFSYDQKSDSPKTQGNGIGLFAAKQLINLNNGSLDVESSPVGTSFYVSFKTL